MHVLGFRDAEFPHSFFRVHLGSGEPVRHWLPYGMPRLNTRFLRSVFFAFRTNPKSGEQEPYGSGVFVNVAPEQGNRWHFYAVTCHHVLLGGGDHLRIGTLDGKHRFIDTDRLKEWEFDLDGDLAVCDVTDHLQVSSDDFSSVPRELWATEEFFKSVDFGVGEDGMMLGLYGEQAGKETNLVASRSGNVTLLASHDDPIERVAGRQPRPSHLFDIRSRPGFSGSPVFVYRTPASDLRQAFMRGADVLISAPTINGNPLPIPLSHQDLKENTFMMLFGIHISQYHDTVTAKKLRPESNIVDGDKLRIPNSVTVVAPAWEIAAILDRPRFIEQRRAREMAYAEDREKRNLPEPEATTGRDAAPERPASAIEGDEQHAERFTALLDAAVGKPKQGG